MPSLNQIVLIGRLTRDPDAKFLADGTPLANFALAVDRPYRTQNGKTETDFFNIVAWRKQAELATAHLQKGRLIAVQGRLQGRSYETQDGQRRKVFEIVADRITFLDKRKDNGPANDLGEEVEDEEVPF